MKEQNEKRRDYETWEEAFRGLAPVVRQQSVRIAAYTQALFIQACAAGFGAQTPAGAQRMQATYADLAYKCGLYHQLGKALVPEEYQLPSTAFTDEEEQLYRKYTADGREVTHLGAFPKGETIRLAVTCPRTLGASAVVLRLNRDGCASTDTPFEFVSEDLTTLTDTYELTLDTAALCDGIIEDTSIMELMKKRGTAAAPYIGAYIRGRKAMLKAL